MQSAFAAAARSYVAQFWARKIIF
uniref:Uncharacterized protein n=1 Tax=Anopheles albimanus TaxID=7167 RepID=A0A182FZE9_ANOAL